MPFEVYPVKPPDTTLDNSKARTLNVVAAEIKDIYTRAEALGGEVIAAHELSIPGVERQSFLFLVARVEKPTE